MAGQRSGATMAADCRPSCYPMSRQKWVLDVTLGTSVSVSTQLVKLIHLQCPFFWGWDVGWTDPETAQPFSKFSR